MEQKKDLTKRLIAQGFKDLVKRSPFEKLTIKMISDEAGIIRPTFYNYYRDKYDVVEWILQSEMLDETLRLLAENKYREGLIHVFTVIQDDMDYYKKVFQITGQNSVEEVMMRELTAFYKKRLAEISHADWQENPALTDEMIARHMSVSMVDYIRSWLESGDKDYTAQQLADAYIYMMRNPLFSD